MLFKTLMQMNYKAMSRTARAQRSCGIDNIGSRGICNRKASPTKVGDLISQNAGIHRRLIHCLN